MVEVPVIRRESVQIFRQKRALVKFQYLLLFSVGLLAPLVSFYIVPGIDPVTALINGFPGVILALIAVVNLCRGALVTRSSVWFVDLPLSTIGFDGIREITMTRAEIGLSILTAGGKTIVYSLGKRPHEADIETFRKLLAVVCERAGQTGRDVAISADTREFLSGSSAYYEQRLADAREMRDQPNGLGGWLGVLCAYLIFTTVVNLAGYALGWATPVTGANGQFVGMMDILVTAVTTLLAIWALYCFFRRKKSFPRNMLLYYGVAALAMVFSGFVRGLLAQNSITLENIVELAVSLVLQATRFFALRGYLRHSLRVRNTFVR